MSETKEPITLLETLDKQLAQSNMIGQWTIDHLLEKAIGGPRPSGEPMVWRWGQVEQYLLMACEALKESATARREVAFLTPNLARNATTQALLAGVQMVTPGELAWAHRHSISALRFGIEGGPKLFTVVNGEALPMEPNDLILNPAWTWHDHHNETGERGVWLDVLDLPIVGGLGQLSYATLGESHQPIVEQSLSGSEEPVRPGLKQPPANRPPMRYAWKDMEQRLRDIEREPADPATGLAVEYVEPQTGGALFPSMTCSIQMLPPGFNGQRHRRTASAVCYVVEGHGRTIYDGHEIAWGPRDVFTVPSWGWVRHVNETSNGRALLFVTSESGLLKDLGLHRQEVQ